MAIRIKFDSANNPEKPTFVLATRNGVKIGGIKAEHIVASDAFVDSPEATFKVYKFEYDEEQGKNVVVKYWDDIVDLKLVWCKEWDAWFQINVEIDEATETEKTVYCTRLSNAELSQIMLYDIEINTDDDIARPDYVEPTVFWNPVEPKASLLHRIMEKAPHYTITHVDHSLIKIQRTFSFDGTSLYDAFQEIAKEIGCIFVLNSNSDTNGNINRNIEVYDLESQCNSCGKRNDFTAVCPNCGSTSFTAGYGKDTGIFITPDELAEDVNFKTDIGSVKNCFKLEGGDDLMTATIRMCNPNGSDYIWYISDDMKKDMSSALVSRLNSYDQQYNYYQNDYVSNVDSGSISRYNALVAKYNKYNGNLATISTPIKGFPALMQAYYNAIDMSIFLESALMPSVSTQDTNASKEVSKLTRQNISPVSVESLNVLSSASADSAVMSMAKVLVDPRYQIKLNNTSYSNGTWSGKFIVINYSDESDTATSGIITVSINGDYEGFIKQKIEKMLSREATDVNITGLLKMSENGLIDELKKYSLKRLISFADSCQSCIDILIEQGIGNRDQWVSRVPNLYDNLYVVYRNKLKIINSEIFIRQSEIDSISGSYGSDGFVESMGLMNYIEKIRDTIQSTLDFQNYLGDSLWKEFCAFRREDKLSNSNFISDGLDNAMIFDMARKFIEIAEKEIIKSALLQHTIESTLKNLMAIDKFKPLIKYFEVGNWLRIQIDGKVYKLRLLSYEIDYDNFDNITVDFSDVMTTADGISDQESLMNKASSMATSYDYTARQANRGSVSKSWLDNWVEMGLDVTNTKVISGSDNQVQTWDNHGMLFRRFDVIIDDYDDIQMKIINSTLAVTDDSWETVKTAVGLFYYLDVNTGEYKRAYGVNAEMVVGKLIIGEGLGIYNSSGSLKFDHDGLTIKNEGNQFIVNPNNDELLVVKHDDSKVLYLDKDGNLNITGKMTATTLDCGGTDGLVFDGENVRLGKNVIITWEIGSRNYIRNSKNLIFDGYSICKIGGEELNYFIDENSNFFVDENSNFFIDNGNTIIMSENTIFFESRTVITPYNKTDSCFYIISHDNSYFYKLKDVISKDGTYTFSIWLKSVSNCRVRMNILGNSVEFDVSDVWKKFTKTITRISDDIDIYPAYNVGLYAYEMQLEDGIIVSSWHEAEEDSFQDISEEYITTIARNSITSEVIKGWNLEVGNQVKMGANAKISWANVENKPDIPDGVTDEYITNITKNTITTAYINGLKITAGSVAVENITGTTISGKEIITDKGEIGGFVIGTNSIKATGENGDIVALTRYTGNNTYVFAIGTPNENRYNTCNFRVRYDGKLYASNASISGDINADTFKADGYFYKTEITDGLITLTGKATGISAFITIDGKDGDGKNRQLGVWDNSISFYHADYGTKNIDYKDGFITFDSQFRFKGLNGYSIEPVGNWRTDVNKISSLGTSQNSSNAYQLDIHGYWGGSSLSTKHLTGATSDVRLKENFEECVVNALEIVNKIKMKSFDWKETGKRWNIGLIADELEKLDENFTTGGGYNEDGEPDYKSVDSWYLMGYLIKSIQELYEMINKQQTNNV